MRDKSNRLRISDLKAIFGLLGECRELGDDVGVWRSHFLAGLTRLVGADIAMSGEMSGVATGQPANIGVLEYGWEQGFDRSEWEAGLQEFIAGQRPDPDFGKYLQSCFGPHQCHSLAELLGKRAWHATQTYRLMFGPAKLDENLYAFFPLLRDSDTSEGLILARAVGRRAFAGRERAIIHELQMALAPLVGGPLARFSEPAPSSLPFRCRQVLQLLLEGDGDKQIAMRLRISLFTVNQYTKLAFRHFGVSSRAELLARWVRRGWNAKATWAALSQRESETK